MQQLWRLRVNTSRKSTMTWLCNHQCVCLIMTSWYRRTFHITDLLCREFNNCWWVPYSTILCRTVQQCRTFMVSLLLHVAWVYHWWNSAVAHKSDALTLLWPLPNVREYNVCHNAWYMIFFFKPHGTTITLLFLTIFSLRNIGVVATSKFWIIEVWQYYRLSRYRGRI